MLSLLSFTTSLFCFRINLELFRAGDAMSSPAIVSSNKWIRNLMTFSFSKSQLTGKGLKREQFHDITLYATYFSTMITLSRNTILKRETQASVCNISYVFVWLAPQRAFPIWEVPPSEANRWSVLRFALAASQCLLVNCNDVFIVFELFQRSLFSVLCSRLYTK